MDPSPALHNHRHIRIHSSERGSSAPTSRNASNRASQVSRRSVSRQNAGFFEVQLSWDQLFELRARSIIRNTTFNSIVSVLTVYSLIADDCRNAFTVATQADLFFDISLLGCLFIFLLEILLRVIVKPSYLFNFYFFADLVSTILLIFDISCISDRVLYVSSTFGPSTPPVAFVVLLNGGRELRNIRFVRMLQNSSALRWITRRILHIPDPPVEGRTESKAGDISNASTSVDKDDELEHELEQERLEPQWRQYMAGGSSQFVSKQKSVTVRTADESKVGRELSEVNTKKVGILVILCSMVAPLISSKDGSINVIPFLVRDLDQAYISKDSKRLQESFDTTVRELREQVTDLGLVARLAWVGFLGTDPADVSLSPPLKLVCDGFPGIYASLAIGGCPLEVRRRHELSEWRGEYLSLIFDEKERVMWTAVLSIVQTCFTVLVILILSVVFDIDCSRIILIPISRIVSTMRQIQANPLCANTLIDNELKDEFEYRQAKEAWDTMPLWKRLSSRKPKILISDSFRELANRDCAQLQRTILKFGSLLVVGFGEAGAEIVGANIAETSGSGGLQTSRPGRIVEAVFGYVSIADFNTVTEVLQDGIVVLVNHVAEIVHGIVDEFNGITSKNLGSGFLLVWKTDQETKERMAELAVTAVCDIVAAIEKSPFLATYRDHPHLKLRIPGYRVRVGMALHAGHAVEGAVGSDFKLDATYLGQDVVKSVWLESLGSRMYQCGVVLSGSITSLLSSPMKARLCRRIDTVSVDASGKELVQLFTVDLDSSDLKVQYTESHDDIKRSSHLAGYMLKQARMERKKIKLDLERYSPLDHFQIEELLYMRRKFNTKAGILFNQIFQKGFLNYQAGEWDVAKKALRQCLVYWAMNQRDKSKNLKISWSTLTDEAVLASSIREGIDGPSLALLKFMIMYSGPSWRGFRTI